MSYTKAGINVRVWTVRVNAGRRVLTPESVKRFEVIMNTKKQ